MKFKNTTNVEAKSFYYWSDGSGRDTYILRNNAGLLSPNKLHEIDIKTKKPKPRYHTMSMGSSTYHLPMPPAPENRVTHYHSDGSGRDNYILINEGGRIAGGR